MSNFTQRTITGFFFVLIVVSAIWYGPLLFALLLDLVIVGCLYEFYKLVMPGLKLLYRWFYILCGLVFFVLSSQVSYERDVVYNLAVAALVAAVFFTFIIQLFSKSEKPFEEIAYAICGWIYICLPFILLFDLASFNYNVYEPFIPLSVLIFIWTNDTFAYLTGRMIGKTPLFPRISPKKTIEGTLGGLLMVVLAAFCISKWQSDYGFAGWAAIGLTAAIFGSLGDLVESMLKRSLNIKDSGNILPGHGGLLDRFDATLIASPFVYVLMLIIS